jgi:tetratricopeptide (TPR) repeat protein
MVDPETLYKSLISVENLTALTIEEGLSHIGRLADLSLDLRQIEGLERAIELSQELQKRDLTSVQLATSQYFLANAWANLRDVSGAGSHWKWEQQETEKETFHLRSALREDGFRRLPDERACQILTNLGNVMSQVGRFVEAIEYWDRALARLPSFSMARGNRGYGLSYYAQSLYDEGHTAVLLKHAHVDLKTALSSALPEHARLSFDERRTRIESRLSSDYINQDTIHMDGFPLGDSEHEIRYRRWCLKNRLFLNPLNDLGPYPIAACDILATPSIVVGIDEGPHYPGYFNQMKQEFVSTRYLYYDGINASQPHFSDREVLLFNTLDYPSYSLAVEKVKAAFRMVYSLFDKIAYFLNHYLVLSIEERRVTFRTFWYASQEKKEGLRPAFQQCRNWPLRGLFWLSKDLFENRPGFRESMEPHARELSEVRNHLEHRYLKLHGGDWRGAPSDNDQVSLAVTDTLAFSMYRREFEAKTLRLIKMARAALIYLSLAIHAEEGQRAEKRDPDSIIPGMPLGVWEDDWKL